MCYFFALTISFWFLLLLVATAVLSHASSLLSGLEHPSEDHTNFPPFPIMTRSQLWRANSSYRGQRWFINDTDSSLRLLNSPVNCLEVFGASNKTGALVNVWRCPTAGGNMKFKIVKAQQQQLQQQRQGQLIKIVATLSGLCLGWESPAMGAPTLLYQCADGAPNKWGEDAVLWSALNNGQLCAVGPASIDGERLCLDAASWIPTGPSIANGYMGTRAGTTQIFNSAVFNGVGGNSVNVGAPSSHFAPASPTARADVYSLDYATATAVQVYTDAVNGYRFTTREYMQNDDKNFYGRVLELERLVGTSHQLDKEITVKVVRWRDALDTDNLRKVNESFVTSPRSGEKLCVTVLSTLLPEVPGVTRTATIVMTENADGLDGGTAAPLTLTIPPGKKSVSKFFPLMYLTDIKDDLFSERTDRSMTITQVALAAFEKFTSVSQASSYARHVAAWSYLWSGNIVMTPRNRTHHAAPAQAEREKMQQQQQQQQLVGRTNSVLQESFYIIYSSWRKGWNFDSSCGGLSVGGCYGGARFWDNQLFSGPNTLLFAPAGLAENIVLYRLEQIRLAGALNNAESIVKVNRGIAWPWQSTYSGYSQASWLPSKFTEIHISSDIIFFQRRFLALGNGMAANRAAFIKRIFPVLQQVADFFVERSTLGTSNFSRCQPGNTNVNNCSGGGGGGGGGGEGHVLFPSVTGPDEYFCGCQDVYTAVSAKIAVEFTIEVAQELNQTVDKKWITFVEQVLVPYDAKRNLHPEHLNYNFSEGIKQASTTAIALLDFKYETENTLANDLDFYSHHVDAGGPGMTYQIFAVGWAAAKKFERAEAAWLAGFMNNTFPPAGYVPGESALPNYIRWTEMSSSGGCQNFLTGAGGFVMSVWRSQLGVKIETGRGSGGGISLIRSQMYIPSFAESVRAQGIYIFNARINVELKRIAVAREHQLELVLTLVQLPPSGTFLMLDGEKWSSKGSPKTFGVDATAADVRITLSQA